MTEQSFNYTPDDICEKIIEYLKLDKNKSYCEPFSGNHNFFKLLPDNKEYYEIQEGRDFFKCDKNYDIIITNPPYKDYETNTKNIMIDCYEKSFDVALEKCIFLINSQSFNSLTPLRLDNWKKKGWEITDIRIYNIKKWYGRYYLITFEKNKQGILSWEI
tara:strand:- start:2327 stop:2806 length:480 start_codon:yes stop_codon:yes gene_type:complete